MLSSLNAVPGVAPKELSDHELKENDVLAGQPPFMERLQITAKIDNLDKVLSFMDGFLEKIDCPMKAQMQIDIAVEELYVNIANYAYAPGEGDAVILVSADKDFSEVVIEFRDWGVPFNPMEKADPDTSLPAEERKIGGLGIFMVKKSMDGMSYRYEDAQNILMIRKKLK